MSATPLYKDLGKKANDTLTRGLPSDKGERTVEWKGTTSDKIALVSKLVTDTKGSTTGTFSYEYKHADWNTTFKNELNTQRQCTVNVDTKNLGTDGLTLKLETKNTDAKAAVEFANDVFALTGSVNSKKDVAASVTVGASGFTLGGDVAASDFSALSALKTRVAYTAGDLDLNLWADVTDKGSDKEKQNVGMSYFYKVNNDWDVAMDIAYDLKPSAGDTKLRVGSQWKQSDDTTWKARMDTTGQLAIAISQKYSDNVAFTLGTSFETTAMDKQGSNKFGWTLNISD